MDQEMTSLSAVNSTSTYSAYRKGMYKVAMVMFGVMMHPTRLGLVTLYPTLCLGNTLFMDFFIICFSNLSLRQVD